MHVRRITFALLLVAAATALGLPQAGSQALPVVTIASTTPGDVVSYYDGCVGPTGTITLTTFPTAQVILTRDDASTDVEVVYEQTGGTAVAGRDIEPLRGDVLFVAGNLEATIEISPLATMPLGETTLEITLTPGAGYTLAGQTTTVATFTHTLASDEDLFAPPLTVPGDCDPAPTDAGRVLARTG